MNIRSQKPGKSGKTAPLKSMVRKLRTSYRPYVAIEQSETHFVVTIGKATTVTGEVWYDGKYRANFSLPPKAREAAPEIQDNPESGKTVAVFKSAEDQGEQSANKRVHFAKEDIEEFKTEISGLIDRVLKELGINSGPGAGLATDPAALKEQFEYVVAVRGAKTSKSQVTLQAERYGDGNGTYFCIETCALPGISIVELFGPVTEDHDKIILPGGFRLRGTVETASGRNEAMDAAREAFEEKGKVEFRHDTIRILSEQTATQQTYNVTVIKASTATATVEVDATTQAKAEEKAKVMAPVLKYGEEQAPDYVIQKAISETRTNYYIHESSRSQGKWSVEIHRVTSSTAVIQVQASSPDEADRKALKAARTMKFKGGNKTYAVGSSLLSGTSQELVESDDPIAVDADEPAPAEEAPKDTSKDEKPQIDVRHGVVSSEKFPKRHVFSADIAESDLADVLAAVTEAANKIANENGGAATNPAMIVITVDLAPKGEGETAPPAEGEGELPAEPPASEDAAAFKESVDPHPDPNHWTNKTDNWKATTIGDWWESAEDFTHSRTVKSRKITRGKIAVELADGKEYHPNRVLKNIESGNFHLRFDVDGEERTMYLKADDKVRVVENPRQYLDSRTRVPADAWPEDAKEEV